MLVYLYLYVFLNLPALIQLLKMRILLLDNYDSFTYNLRQLLVATKVSHKLTIAYHDKICLEAVQRFDKILLSPGAGLPQEAGIMPALIKEYASQKSILGVCLGHQAVAEGFGGSLYRLPAPHHGQVGKLQILVEDSTLLQNVAQNSRVGLYHSWAVARDSILPEFDILAQAGEVVMAIQHKRYAICGVQFHPESMMTECGVQILKNWLK